MNLNYAIARGKMALPAFRAQSGTAELLVTSENHAQCPISRHTAGPCCHQASLRTLFTNPIQMLGLLKESAEFALAAQPIRPAFQIFFSVTDESGKPLLNELQHTTNKQQEAVLSFVFCV